jgi:hypothetical protein
VVAKVVVDVFARTGRIWHLHAGGQVIRTTAEHPFFVVRVWDFLSVSELQAGDLLLWLDGQLVRVEEVCDTGEYETVYNVCVADFHTYFVGCQDWGFSVWAHNAGYTIVKLRGVREFTIIDGEGQVIPALLQRKEGVGFQSVEAAQGWAKGNLPDGVVNVNRRKRVSRPTGPHTEPIGQIHHPLSNPIMRELEQNPTLKGQFKRRDYTTRAWDEVAHSGYDRFHIELDREVIAWIRNPANRAATPDEFVAWLRWRYNQPDVKIHFPNGF